MSDEVRVWRVASGDSLLDVEPTMLGREERIENWIAQDTSVLEPGKARLMLIGRQVKTDFNKEIDLLCINSKGDLVVVELKRAMTPREVTAQALDYASWVKDLGSERVKDIALKHFRGAKTLNQAFKEFFEIELPDVINADHAIRIVAADVDDSTERIVRYLSDKGIDINFVRFHLFKSDEIGELLVRTFTVAPDEAEQNFRKSGVTKRTRFIKTLEIRIQEAKNSSLRDFLSDRVSDPAQERDRRGIALIYRVGGKIRFRVRGRRKHAHVLQVGRFTGDEELWNQHLSSPHIGLREKGANLSFQLGTPGDFDFFQKFVCGDANRAPWSGGDDFSLGDLADYGEEDDGEEEDIP